MLECSNWLTKRPPRREERRRRDFGHEAHAQAAFFSVTSCEWRAARPAPEGKDRGEGVSGPLGDWTAERGTHHSPLTTHTSVDAGWTHTGPSTGPLATLGPRRKGRVVGRRGSIRLAGCDGLVALAGKGCSWIPANLLFGRFSLGSLGRRTTARQTPRQPVTSSCDLEMSCTVNIGRATFLMLRKAFKYKIGRSSSQT